MRATAGASPDPRAAFGGLMLIFVLAGLTIAGVLLAPNLVLNVVDRNRAAEEQTLTRLHSSLLHAIERTQSIPAPTNWSSFLPPFASADQTGIKQAYPSFPNDTNAQRFLLVDPGLPAGLLPYVQDDLGLIGSETNLLGTNARLILVSNTRRSLGLPITNHTLTPSAFDALWSWAYNPVTKAPPSGWPASWTSRGEFIHIKPINLADSFHKVSLASLRYGVGETNNITNSVTSQTNLYFLRGTRLALADSGGTLQRIHVINHDIAFAWPTSSPPILWWKFSETSGPTATNSGSLGNSAKGAYTNGVTLGSAGPRPPGFPGFSAGNTAISLDGSNDYVKGTNGLINNLTGFTLAGWINPSAANVSNKDLFGQLGMVEVIFETAMKLTVRHGPKKAFYHYPYGSGEWHHVAATGDGVNLRLYVDGALVDTGNDATATYGANANAFSVGANISGAGNYFPGLIDDVIAYTRALSDAGIAQLHAGSLP